MTNQSYIHFRTASVDRSVWRSVRVGAEIAGKWWISAWVLTLLSGIVAFGLTAANLANLNPAIWLALLALGLFVAPAVALHFLRIERDDFKALWDDKNRLIELLAQLEQCRAAAAKLQIQGMHFARKAEFDAWSEKVAEWTNATQELVYLLHPAEAGNFYTLGLFQPELAAGTELLNPKHRQILVNFIRRIHILETIRDRWTTRVF